MWILVKKKISAAIEYAKRNDIEVITSTPCMELWFLLHYNYTTAYLSNDEVMRRLKCYQPKYEKNFNIYPLINSNVDWAIKNAKKLLKYQIDNGKVIGKVDANPNTEVYKIVEYLISNS